MIKRKTILNLSRTNGDKLISWRHPGGKLLRLGSESLTDTELIAILIGSGVPGKTATEVAEDVFKRFQSFRGMAGKPIEEFKKIKGLKTVKIVRIMAAFEMAKRIVDQVLKEQNE